MFPSLGSGQGEPILSDALAIDIAHWYYSLVSDFDDYTDIVFQPKKHANGHYYIHCKFNFVNPNDINDALFHQQIITDPDQNGNYPITFHNQKYFVIGTIP